MARPGERGTQPNNDTLYDRDYILFPFFFESLLLFLYTGVKKILSIGRTRFGVTGFEGTARIIL